VRILTIFIFTAQIFFSVNLYAEKVFIVSDVHGNLPLLSEMVRFIKNNKDLQNIDYVLANGDIVNTGGEPAIQQIEGFFKIILDNFPSVRENPKHLIFAPGNWDGNKIEPMRLRQLVRPYTTPYDALEGHTNPNSKQFYLGIKRNINDINDLKMVYSDAATVALPLDSMSPTKKFGIMYGHFPQFIIPAEGVNQEAYLYAYFKGQAHSLLTMNKKLRIPPEIDLVVFSHTHIPIYFLGINGRETRRTLVLNPGGLELCRKNSWDPNSFAILDTTQRTVQFFAWKFEINPKECGVKNIFLSQGKPEMPIKIFLDSYKTQNVNVPIYNIFDWNIAYSTRRFTELHGHRTAIHNGITYKMVDTIRRKKNIEKFLKFYGNNIEPGENFVKLKNQENPPGIPPIFN
jgi:predicted phosphodiesterase